ncbi:MAG: tetratricopeptide repeat protein [Alphaproteobacteria bacterium]
MDRFRIERGRAISAVALLAVLWLPAASMPAQAGLDEGIAAYQRSDYAVALSEFQPLAKAGNPTAQYRLGQMYFLGQGVAQNPNEAAKWFRSAAEKGDAGAQYHLGLLFDTGRGVKENAAEAAKWFRLAAEQNDPQAQFTLGYLYQDGRGVAKNGPEALKWYQRAAEQGHAIALFAMGICYRGCLGVTNDPVQTHMWLELAHARLAPGNMRDAAGRIRDKVAAKMTPAQIAEAQRLAQEWRPVTQSCGQPLATC